MWVDMQGRVSMVTPVWVRIVHECGVMFVGVVSGTQEDVDKAVGVANVAYGSWSKLPCHVRARHMYSIARHVQKHAR